MQSAHTVSSRCKVNNVHVHAYSSCRCIISYCCLLVSQVVSRLHWTGSEYIVRCRSIHYHSSAAHRGNIADVRETAWKERNEREGRENWWKSFMWAAPEHASIVIQERAVRAAVDECSRDELGTTRMHKHPEHRARRKRLGRRVDCCRHDPGRYVVHSVIRDYTWLWPPGLPSWTIARTVTSELLGFCFSFSLFFVSVPCARLSWPSRQLLSARKSTVSYSIVMVSRFLQGDECIPGYTMLQVTTGPLQTFQHEFLNFGIFADGPL